MKSFKKLLALTVAVMMALYCMPAGLAVSVEDYDPVGDDISGTVSPYLEQGGAGSSVNFLTVNDFASHYITFINIWSNGCGPCVNEMPYFQQIHEEYGDQGVLVVGGCTTWIGGSYAQEYAYLQSQGYTYMNVIPDSILYNLYAHNQFVPQTFIVNSDGIVVDFIGGSTTYNGLLQKVQYWLSVYGGDHEDHTVTFVDGITDEVIETQIVAHATAPVYPTPPEHEGYTFTRWSPANVTMVLEDMTITANYNAIVYRVRFYDSIDDTLIKSQFVRYGQAATAPTPPTHEGCTFVGWDRDFSYITAAMDVHTIYEVNAPEGLPGDVNVDGAVSFTDVSVLYGYLLGLNDLDPDATRNADFDGDGTVTFNDVGALYYNCLGI